MLIDPNKVNLSEADIESWLYENPSKLVLVPSYSYVKRWVARQMVVPSGRIDLLGITNNGLPVVVELKNVPIDSAALAQVCRYAYDIENIGDFRRECIKVVIGKGGIGKSVMHEAEAMGVWAFSFDVHLSASLSSWKFNDEYLKKCKGIAEQIRASGILDVFSEVEQEKAKPESSEEIPDAFKDFLDRRENPSEE